MLVAVADARAEGWCFHMLSAMSAPVSILFLLFFTKAHENIFTMDQQTTSMDSFVPALQSALFLNPMVKKGSKIVTRVYELS